MASSAPTPDSVPGSDPATSARAEPAPAPNTDKILLARDGSLGRIVLNRPKAINALTTDMVEAVSAALAAWADDPAVQVVTIEGAGERGLCAGGDVVAARAAALEGADATHFFAAEYAMNARLATYPKPIVAWMDGIVMGGGVGVSGFCRHRLVTDRSAVAMPETIIGFFPDVGATYLLARAPGELGTHLSLTGSTVNGADAVAIGLADEVVNRDAWPSLLDALAAANGPDEVSAAIEALPAVTSQAQLLQSRTWIDECYAGDDPALIARRLAEHAEPEARAAADLIAARSPLAVAASLEAIRRSADAADVPEVLEQDFVLAGNLVQSGDFAEGVRAQLVDKDRTPHWSHPDLAAVSREEVLALFEPSAD